MLVMKENVIVYTIQLDTEEVEKREEWHEVTELFKREFEKEGMDKEAKLMEKGGFSYKKTERNSYYTEFQVMITTRRKIV